MGDPFSSLSLEQQSTTRVTRRVLPWISQWTILCRQVQQATNNNDDDYRLVDIIGHIQPPNRLPVPAFIALNKEASRYPSPVNIAYWFYYHGLNVYRTAAAIVQRSDCPHIREDDVGVGGNDGKTGPLIALQRRRRLPNRSLLTLLTIGSTLENERSCWISPWYRHTTLPTTTTTTSTTYDSSTLPQRAVVPNTLYLPIDQRTYLGILHLAVRHSTSPVYSAIMSAILPSCPYRNTPMLTMDLHSPDYRTEDMKIPRVPWMIAALDGNAESLAILEAHGCKPPSKVFMPDNELLLRQTIRQFGHSIQLPYVPIEEYEIDRKADATILQGFNSRVHKAIRVNDDNKKEYAVKIIPLPDNPTKCRAAVESIANDIRLLEANASGLMYSLSANDAEVILVTDFFAGGTLESHLPTLEYKRNEILKNEATLSINERRMMYICSILDLINCVIHIVDDLHSLGELHRDIRLSNIMFKPPHRFAVDEDDPLTLIDFGFSTRDTLTSDDAKRTDPYFYCVNAPEVANGGVYTKASEVWSLGMILLSFWTCQKPFDTSTMHPDMVRSAMPSS
jgi:hypothetical protein